MDTAEVMPPLPEPKWIESAGCVQAFTEDQLRAYGAAVVEACAEVAMSAPIKTAHQDKREACSNAIRRMNK